jgi:D-serine deaminase-like pyridoxal phosphate-dependent protein
MSRWYCVENVDEVDSPALLVYPDRVQENIERMIGLAGGTARLRPHVKTHKMAEIVQMQLAAGIDKFKAATLAEAEMTAACGAGDVLIAFHLLGPKIPRLVELLRKFPETRFGCLADDERAIRALSSAMSAAGLQLDVYLDIDNGLGRTGIAPGAQAAQLYRLVHELPGLRAGGLHVYDGQFRQPQLSERIAACDAAFEPVRALRQQLEAQGLPVPTIVAGGTPTFPVHARHSDVQCSPGTCLLWDEGYGSKFPDLQFLHAAVLVTRVISKPRTDRVCLDLGYKAVSPDQPHIRVKLLDLPDAQPIVHNEEHLAVESPAAAAFQVGDVLYGIPMHVCPTVALHREVVVVRQSRAVERWLVTARDRRLSV